MKTKKKNIGKLHPRKKIMMTKQKSSSLTNNKERHELAIEQSKFENK